MNDVSIIDRFKAKTNWKAMWDPFVVIDRLTVWQAATSPDLLEVILIGVCVTLPVMVGYTGFSYRVFRGKTIELDYA